MTESLRTPYSILPESPFPETEFLITGTRERILAFSTWTVNETMAGESVFHKTTQQLTLVREKTVPLFWLKWSSGYRQETTVFTGV